MKTIKIVITALLVIFICLFFFFENNSPDQVVVDYVKLTNSYNFDKIDQFRKTPIDKDVFIPAEFLPITKFCSNISVKVTDIKINGNFSKVSVVEDFCSVHEIILIFKEQESNSSISDADKNNPELKKSRLSSYLNLLKRHSELYIHKVNKTYDLEKINGRWLIVD